MEFSYKSKPANYRPVSLTSVCCKVIEHINHSHLMKFFENKNILTDYQHGFRKKRSCESQLITTIQDLLSGIDSSTQIDAILLDFIKNSSGSRNVPWGTPEVTGAVSNATLSTITLWVRPARKLLIQFKVGLQTQVLRFPPALKLIAEI
jgi:type I restriction-modification system DNA methylase subunit